MKRILLVGGGHAHLAVLRALKQQPLPGARFALVTPRGKQLYSGMLPGVIAGHYRRREAEIDLEGLTQAAGAELIEGRVARLDPERRVATLEDGTELEYEIASLNVGSRIAPTFPGAGLGVAAKPFDAFFERLRDVTLSRVAIVGAGAAGAELAMALRYRGAAVTLYSQQPQLSPARLHLAVRRMGVDLRPGMAVSAIEPGPEVVARSSRQAFDAVILATGASPYPWLITSGLSCDEQGFVQVGPTLQSLSHPEVFAAGDCAAWQPHPLPRSGVYALRQGETLVQSFRSLAQEGPAVPYQPQRHTLLLLSCGRRYAIAERAGWSAEGRWAWWWKDRIDRRWIRSLRA